MFSALLKRRQTHESGFTMIELLVAVVIIAILAAIAVPVYLNLKNEAARSALKSDVNATVKAAGIALTQGTDLTTITANDGAAYVAGGKNAGEKIYIAAIDSTATTTGAAFVQDRDNSNDGYVIRSATYSGPATGVAKAANAAATTDQYFYVYGVLDKSAGAPVNYTYSFNSVQGKYSQSPTDGSTAVVNSAPTMPVLIPGTLPQATIGKSYTGSVSATGNPAPTFAATGLPTGLVMDSVTGAISGTSNAAANTYTVSVKATNSIGSATQSYSLNLVDSAKVKINTTSLASAYTGASYTGAAIDVTNTATSGSNVFDISGLPTGFTYSTSTGVISGQSATTSTNTLTVKVTNGTAVDTASIPFSVAVGVAPAFTAPSQSSLSVATLGSSYSLTVTTTGTPAPTVTVTNLPAGLSYDAVQKKIVGTPTAVTSGPVNVTINAKNDVNPSGTNRTFNIRVDGVQFYATGFDTIDPVWSGGTKTASYGNNSGQPAYIISGGPITYTPTTLVPGAKYTYTAYAFSNNQAAKATVKQGGVVTDTGTTVSGGGWQQYSVTFTAQSSTAQIITTSYGIIDDVLVTRVG